jgi:FkbM family methyltransferase
MGALGEAAAVLRWTWVHPANSRRRLRSVGRAVVFQTRGRVLGKPTQARIGRSGVLLVDLHAAGASKAVYANPPDWPEMLIWKQRLHPGDLFVDVGANAGIYTVFAGDLGAEVIAVEPMMVDRLRRNIALNPTHHVTVVEAAAHREAGEIRFDPTDDAMGHISAEGALTVDAVTLDDVLGDRHAAGVKIDVECAELDVLVGAQRALAEHRIGCLQIETLYVAEVADLLQPHGYTVFETDSDGRFVPAGPRPIRDVFAVPD